MSDAVVIIDDGATTYIQGGMQGPPGVGVPIGGTIGQSLVKASNADLDTVWSSVSSGGANVTISSQNADSITLPTGTPVAIQTPGVVRAKASDNTRPAIGLLTLQSVTNTTAIVQLTGSLTLADWTNVAGVVSLTPRQLYYVDYTTPGKLTTTVPTATGQLIQIVGVAITTDTLDIILNPPVLL